MDLLTADKELAATAPIVPKLAFTDTDADASVFNPLAACPTPAPFLDIFPSPIDTAPRDFAMDPIDNPEIVLIPLATLLNP